MSTGDKIFGAMAWSGIERISLQAIQFILGIILARILSPEDYGIMAILFVFIVLSRVFIDSGFTKALIQKIDRDDNDKSTVLFFNIGISLLCYSIIYATAPYIALFYEIESLTNLLRVIAISLIINGLYTVPNTLLTIDLNFKTITKVNLISVILSGTIAIYLAYQGFGVWSLVYQTLIRSILMAILLWFLIKWKPNWRFSINSFRQMFSYGYKLLISSLLANLFSNLNSLLIGKYVGTNDLGFFSRGTQFSDALYNVFSPAINGVLLPGLAPLQKQKELLVAYTRTIMKATAMITVPLFFMLAILAEPIILLLLTDKWALAIPIMQIFCFARVITIFVGININILYVIGRTDLVLKQEYLCIVIRVILVLAALKFGIVYIALAELIASLFHFFINAYYPGKFMNYGSIKQLKDNTPIIVAGLITLLAIYLTSLIF